MTEKNYNPEQKQVKAMEKQRIAEKSKKEIVEIPKQEKETKEEPKKIDKTEKVAEEKTEKEVEKTEKKQETKVKKTEAIVDGRGLPISTKKSAAICKFIKNKTIEKAISDLNEVLEHKKSVPMKGEIPHRKGPGKIASGSGGYPKKPVEYFIKLLKSLSANANVNGLDNPLIVEAIANMASRPYGKFGAIRRKRTHVMIKAKGKKSLK